MEVKFIEVEEVTTILFAEHFKWYELPVGCIGGAGQGRGGKGGEGSSGYVCVYLLLSGKQMISDVTCSSPSPPQAYSLISPKQTSSLHFQV